MSLDKVVLQDGLRIGQKELSELQGGSKDRQTLLNRMITVTPGIALRIRSNGTLENGCDVRVGAGYNIFVGSGMAMDVNGNIIEIPEDTGSFLIGSASSYIVLLSYSTSTQELGTLRLYFDSTASVGLRNRIEGTGSDFSNIRAGHLLQISGSTGAFNGIYEIVQVVDETNLIVSEYKHGEISPTYFTDEESSLTFEVLGDYASGYPVSGDKQIYSYQSYTIELREESLGYTEGLELVLARVSRTIGTTVQVVDLRGRNILTLLPTARNSIDEYFAPIAPAHVRVITGSIDMVTRLESDDGFTRAGTYLDMGTTTTLNSYLKVTWGHHCSADDASSVSYDSGTGYYTIRDNSLESGELWTTDYWKNAEHYLVDSENVIHKIVASDSNGVKTLTEPAPGEFWITPNAEEYIVLVETVDSSGDLIGEYFSDIESHSSSPVRMEYYTRNVISGQRYRVRVASRKNGLRSAYINANPNPIIAGDIGRPDILPSVNLSHPFYTSEVGDPAEYMGVVNLKITNFSDCVGSSYPAVAFEIFAKQSTSSTDFPDTTSEYLVARITGDNYQLTARNTASSANRMNIKVRAISATGQYATPSNTWQGSIETGLYASLTESTGGSIGGYSIASILSMVSGLAGGSTPSGALGVSITNMIQNVCCCGSGESGTSSTGSTTSSTESEITSQQHYINFFRKGNILNGTEIFETELGTRYAIVVNEFRLSNYNEGSGSPVLRISGDGGSQNITLPAGERAFDNSALPAIRKSLSGSLEVQAVSNELRDVRGRIGFQIEEFGFFQDAGESVDEHLETLFAFMGAFIPDQEIEVEEGVDYVGNFEITDFDFILQHPSSGGNLVIRVGNASGGLGDYVEITIPDGETQPTDLSAFSSVLEVPDPSQLWAKVVGDPHGAGYGELTCRIINRSQRSGSYPYSTPPHFFTKYRDGEFLQGSEMNIARRGIPLQVVWVEIHLQRPTEENLRFKIKSTYDAHGVIYVEIPTGGMRANRAGAINLPQTQNLKIEMVEGNAEYFTVLLEAHRNLPV